MTNSTPEPAPDERILLGEKLRDSRKYVGLTQDEVAKALGLPRTAIVEIEAGQRKVDALELKRLASLYKQSVSYLTGEDAKATDLPAAVAHLARQVADLSDADRSELSRFADFLRARSKE